MARNADCGSRIAECKVRKAHSGIGNLAAWLLSRLLALIFCFGLAPALSAQTAEKKCGSRIADRGTEADRPTQKVESQTPDSGGQLSILKPNLLDAERQTSTDQYQPIESKLPAVRCTLAPSKDVVRWQSTPVADNDRGMRIADCGTDNPKVSSQASKDKSQTSNDCGLRNADRGTNNPQSAIRNPHFNSDAWFQISTDTQEPTEIQETVLATSTDDGNKAGPQPLAQVLANLARAAERNFVDPGIPADETIAYNFADSDLDPWEAFTRIAEARGYRIGYWGDIVTLSRNQQDPLSPVNPHTVKAEVWVWVDQSAKSKVDRRELILQLAGADVAPSSKPQTVRSLEAGSKATISFIDAQSERGDSTLRLTVNPVLLPNGNIEAGLEIENAVPSFEGHKGVTIRRNINHTLELTPTKQVVEIDGILMPTNDPAAGKQSWIQRLFRSKKAPEKSMARMVVKLTVEPVGGSQTPMPSDNPVRIPGSDSGKTGIVLAPGQVRRTPELTSIQTLKH
jgi:hypothetical protein